jgi:hypothetical protein
MDKLTTTAYGSSFVALFGGMTTNDFAMFSGVVIGVATFGMNSWFKYQHLKIAKQQTQKKG